MTKHFHNFDDGRVPVPREHRNVREMASVQQNAADLTIYEVERPAETYLFSDYSVEVTQ